MVSFFVFSIIVVFFVIKLKGTSVPEEVKKNESSNYDFLIYNTEPSLEKCFEKLVDEYKNMSGIVPSVITKDVEMLYNFNNNDENVPDIFMIKNSEELKSQNQYGNILDFLNASEKTFQEVMKGIPEMLRLKINSLNNCGVPLSINGFGWVVNKNLLSSIFGEEAYKNVINDLITCSYDDFVNFVNDIKSSNLTTLNGNSYSINRKSLESMIEVFSITADFSVPKLLNIVFAGAFESPSDLSYIENISNLTGKFSDWMHMLDIVTSNTAFKRGKDFISLDKNSRSKAIKDFSDGKFLFLLSDDSDFDEIKKTNSEVASHLMFIPIKIPNKVEENKDVNTNLTVYCPYYLSVNVKSPKSKFAQDFLTWLVSSPSAKKYLLESSCALYNVKDPGTVENSLTSSALNYLQSDNILAPIFQGIKKSWINAVSQQLAKQYLVTSSWNSSQFDSFDAYCIKKWLY